MSIRINHELCIGCGKCCRVCPGTLIAQGEDGKAKICYPRDCWGCVSCVKECPVEAIEYFLGADIGGRGSTLTVERTGNILHWKIKDPSGNVRVIDIDRSKSNKY